MGKKIRYVETPYILAQRELTKKRKKELEDKAKQAPKETPKEESKKPFANKNFYRRCYATKDPKRNAEIRESIKKKEAAKK